MAHGGLAEHVVARKSGGNLVSMFHSRQPAGNMSDPAVPTFVMVQNVGGIIRHRSDMGDGMRYRIDAPGSLHVLRPDYATDIDVHGSHEIRTFAWPANWVVSTMARHEALAAHLLGDELPGRAFQSETIYQLLDLLWQSGGDGGVAEQLAVEGLSLNLLAELARIVQQPVALSRGGLAPWAARRCIEFVDANLHRQIGIAELAAIADLSPFHFARAFKASIGMAPGSYQRQRRVQRAKELLQTSELPVIEVAAAVGYDTPQAFARIFRRSAGVTPSLWRRRHRREGAI